MTPEQTIHYLLGAIAVLGTAIASLFAIVITNCRNCERERKLLWAHVVHLYDSIPGVERPRSIEDIKDFAENED